MKRILLVVLMALVMLQMPAKAQNNDEHYRELVAKVTTTSSVDISSLRSMFLGMARQKDAVRAEQIVDEYLGGPFQESMVNIMTKYYKKYLSESEMEAFAKEAQTPEYLSMQAHNLELQNKTGEIAQYTSMVLQKVMQGDTDLEPVKTTVPESYAKVFMAYYEQSDIKNIIAKALNSILALAGPSADPQVVKQISVGVDYLSENMSGLMCNLSYGILSEDELRLSLRMTQQYHLNNVMEDYVENVMQEGFAIMSDFSNWMEKKGVE